TRRPRVTDKMIPIVPPLSRTRRHSGFTTINGRSIEEAGSMRQSYARRAGRGAGSAVEAVLHVCSVIVGIGISAHVVPVVLVGIAADLCASRRGIGHF